MSAKDKGTGKEQSMTITGGSSLPKEDIERMVREAQEHEAEDKARREAAELKNLAESSVYQVEKLLKENEGKVSEGVKKQIEEDLADLKSALEKDDKDAIKAAFEKLGQSQQKMGEEIYKAAASQNSAGSSANSAGSSTSGEQAEDIVDAEVVDDSNAGNADPGTDPSGDTKGK